jgi:hypothetical protein
VRIYLSDIDLIIEMATDATQDSAKRLANAPSHLKGYGHIRSNNRETWLEHRDRYRKELQLVQPLQLTDVNDKGTHE